MKCPHCDYKDGYEWGDEELQAHEGVLGKFWKMPVDMTKERGWGPTETTSLYACPSCSKTFID